MNIKKTRKFLCLLLSLTLMLSLSVSALASVYTDGKYTNTIVKKVSGSSYTITAKMRVTSGEDSHEKITVKIRKQEKNGTYSAWKTETSNNAVELMVKKSDTMASPGLGWQGYYSAKSMGKVYHYLKS